jgi:prolyl-tRNA synthetase
VEKSVYQLTDIDIKVENLLGSIQENLFPEGTGFQENNIYKADTWEEFNRILDTTGGFVSAHWDGTPETEQRIKEESKATIRVIPLNNPKETGTCIFSGKPSTQRVLFARAY